MKKGVLIFWGIILAVIVLAFGSSLFLQAQPGAHDQLAQCIKKQGVVFYGAFWCPHCQRTKALFGTSAKYLPYVECSTPDGKNQTQICIDKKINSYPTWVRPDGATMGGEHPLSEWAAFSGCTLEGQMTAFSEVTATTSSEKTQVP
jgi:thiol-disulfide isomerase/thioredoxin